jgi:hypothetical protein
MANKKLSSLKKETRVLKSRGTTQIVPSKGSCLINNEGIPPAFPYFFSGMHLKSAVHYLLSYQAYTIPDSLGRIDNYSLFHRLYMIDFFSIISDKNIFANNCFFY